MSKKLLSAVLAIAMVVSLCASLFTVSTSAATNYEADREDLKEAIYELFVKGPDIDEDARRYLVDTGILTKVCDKCDITDGEVERYKVFKPAVGRTLIDCEKKCDEISAAYVADEAYLGTFNTDAVEEVILKAASAYYFGQNADELVVDASFNAGRNTIVKDALDEVNGVLKALKANVGAEEFNNNTVGENKPGYNANGNTGYAEVYENWVTSYHNEAYNPNFGINPYGSVNSILINDWYNILQGYTGVTFPLWYSFAEMRADSTVAPLLNAFERLYRAAQTNKVEGVLFYDFVLGDKATLEEAWEDLCDALMAKYTWNKPTTASAAAEIKAYHNMLKVVAFYDYYISDAYQNIYTSANQELLANVAMAKLVDEFVNNEVIKIYAIGADYFNELANAIVAGIAALDPAAAGLALANADIAEGTAIINEAKALLSFYTNWAGLKDSDYDKYIAWTNLNTAVEDLKIMLPYDANSYAMYTIPADTSANTEDFNGDDNKTNDAITVTFAPNYFAYIRFLAKLEVALDVMVDEIDDYNDTIASLDKVSSASSLNKAALKEALLAYDFLAGTKLGYDKDNDLVKVDALCVDYDGGTRKFVDADFVDVYTTYVKEFIVEIVSVERDKLIVEDDQAASQMELFIGMFEEARDIYNNGESAAVNYFKNIDFKKTSWDWKTNTVGGEKNGYAAVAEKLIAFLPYLTAELEQIINLYAYIADEVAFFFGVPVVLVGIDISDYTDALCHMVPANYPGYETDTNEAFVKVLEKYSDEDEIVDKAEDLIDAIEELEEVEIGNVYVEETVEVICGGEYYEMMMAYLDLVALCKTDDQISEYLLDALNFKGAYEIYADDVNDGYVNAAVLNDAYNKFMSEVEDLLTADRGIDLLDEFEADVASWVSTKYVKDDAASNNNWELYEKLRVVFNTSNSILGINSALALPISATEPYLYYNFTLAHVVEHDFAGNKYEWLEQFVEYIYNPLATKSKALEKDYTVSDYDREWSAKYAEVRTTAGYVLEMINGVHTNDNFNKFDVDLEGAENNYFIGCQFYNGQSEAGPEWATNKAGDIYFELKNIDEEEVAVLALYDKEGNWLVSAEGKYVDGLVGVEFSTKDGWAYADQKPYYAGLFVDDEMVSAVIIEVECTPDFDSQKYSYGEWAKYPGVQAGSTAEAAITSDITLSFVLALIESLDAVNDEKGDHTVDAIAAYKAGTLDVALANAANKNVYDYLTDTDAGAKVWANYEAAYAAAVAAKYDLRMPKSEIDAVVDTLNKAVASLELVKKPTSASTTADLEAKIVEAEALLVIADDLDTAVKVMRVDELKAAIADAKQFLVDLKYVTTYNNSYDIDAEIAKVQTAIDNVYASQTFADDLVAYLTFILNAVQPYYSEYTTESYNALIAAWDAAQKVAMDDSQKASVYVAAKASVAAAYEALEYKPAPTMTKTYEAAVAKLAELKAVSTEGYTAESVAEFNAAVAALEAGIEAVAEDDALLELIANAYIAKAGLAVVVDNPITCDD